MKRALMSEISLVLLAGASLSPAMAAGPRASDANNWPGMSQLPNSGIYRDYRPDAAASCGIYDTYCYYDGRLSLDNNGQNR